jgi:hypothetical protein
MDDRIIEAQGLRVADDVRCGEKIERTFGSEPIESRQRCRQR